MSSYYVAGVPYSSELYHHGIKGQKWGIRRFQNPDGSLTAAGIKRYGTVENFNKAQQAKKRGMSEATKKKLKTAAKVAGVAAGVGLAAYGAHKLNKAINSGHENYINNSFTKPKLDALERSRKKSIDLVTSVYDYEGVDRTFGLSRINSFTNAINKDYNVKVSSLLRERDALKNGASFVEKLSNAREWRRYMKNH